MQRPFTLMKREKDVNELGHWLRILNNNFINSVSLDNILLQSVSQVVSLLLKVSVTRISVGHMDRYSLGVKNSAQCLLPSRMSMGARLFTCLNSSSGPLVSE